MSFTMAPMGLIAPPSPSSGSSGGGSSSTLANNLVAFWKLDEASGTRYDSVGSNHLTSNNNVGQATGKIGSAADFTATSSQYLSVDNNADVGISNQGFTLAAWVNLKGINISQVLAGKYTNNPGNNRCYGLLYGIGAGGATFFVSDNGSNFASVGDVGLSANTWHLLVGRHSQGQNISLSVNGGTPTTLSHTTGVYNGAAPFVIGALNSGANATYFANANIDAVGLWKRCLTDAEVAELWNNGNGKEYPFSGSSGTALTYASNGDTNGVCYYAGTNYGAAGWSNPHTAGRVVVTFSESYPFQLPRMVDRLGGSECYTGNSANSWIALDLGVNHALALNHYSLRHDMQSSQFIRSWKIQGSNNAAYNTVTSLNTATWTDLDVQTNNTTINASDAWVSKQISGVTTGYRWLRVLQTGVNSSNEYILALGEFEFYGTFV